MKILKCSWPRLFVMTNQRGLDMWDMRHLGIWRQLDCEWTGGPEKEIVLKDVIGSCSRREGHMTNGWTDFKFVVHCDSLKPQ